MPERKPLFQSSTLSDDERRKEADQICEMLSDQMERMSSREREFIESLADGREVTPRMLYWARDIKDKFC
jgi:hypothetical protein